MLGRITSEKPDLGDHIWCYLALDEADTQLVRKSVPVDYLSFSKFSVSELLICFLLCQRLYETLLLSQLCADTS